LVVVVVVVVVVVAAAAAAVAAAVAVVVGYQRHTPAVSPPGKKTGTHCGPQV
jgi:hypothetical protein